MNFKQQLDLFQELKDSSLPKTEDDLEKLLNKKDIYDINPNTNFEILKKALQRTPEYFKNIFLTYIQTLTLKKRNEIISKMKGTEAEKLIVAQFGSLDKTSYLNKYFTILRELNDYYKDKTFEKYKDIKLKFKTKYYVDNESMKIPLIYGTNELRYSGLINDLYQNLFYRRGCENFEKSKKKKTDENKLSHNYPEKILQKKEHNNKINENKINNIIKEDNYIYSEDMDIENDLEEKKEQEEDEDANFGYFHNMIKFSKVYLDIICSKEFFDFFGIKDLFNYDDSEKFYQDYQLNPEIDCLYFHLLCFDLVVTIFSFYGYNGYDYSFEKYFFEEKATKLSNLKLFKKKCKFIRVKNNEEIKWIKTSDINNEDYIMVNIEDEKETFIFNPYDYILEKMQFRTKMKFNDIVLSFKNPNNFSLIKIFKDKKLFDDSNLFNIFKDNVKTMLKSDIIDQLFNQFKHFNEYKNPFKSEKKDEFINQVFDVILYLPIPFKNVFGFTYKNFGLIFINNQELENKNVLPTTFLLKSISNVGFKKVVNMHEIACHYISCIIHGNNISHELKTPPNSLNGYCTKEEYKYLNFKTDFDNGEKGESLLFGNIIKYLHIKGSLYILNNENWNTNIDKFSNIFIGLNNPDNSKNEVFNFDEESKKDAIVSYLYNKTKNFMEISPTVKINKANSYFKFKSSDSDNDMNDDDIYENGVIFPERLTHKDITFKKRKFD